MDRRSFLAAGLAAGVPAGAAGTGIRSSLMLWTLPGTFEQKLEIAARAGFESVELTAEYVDWAPAGAGRVKKLARSLGLGMDTILATPNWWQRPVSMVDPAHREQFLRDVAAAIEWAQRLEIPQVILVSGNEVPGRPRAVQRASLLEGARRAADLAAKGGVTLILEPLNSKVDRPGYFLTTCVEGLELVRAVDHPHLRLLFDIYHEQVEIGNILRTIGTAAPLTAVFHLADNPGRHEPGTGEINYPNVYRAIAATGFRGYVTMEYFPLGDPAASLQKAVREMWAGLRGGESRGNGA